MSEQIASPKLFDLAAVLSGRSFPEVEVPFYIDEAAALKLARRERLADRLSILGKEDEAAEMLKEAEEFKQAVKDSRYVCHLRGISNKARQDLFNAALTKYPRERDFLGTEAENPARDELFTTLLWHAMVTKIVAPDGAIQVGLSFDQIQGFRDLLPNQAIIAIQEGVAELMNGAKAGFELAAQDSDFLSQP